MTCQTCIIPSPLLLPSKFSDALRPVAGWMQHGSQQVEARSIVIAAPATLPAAAGAAWRLLLPPLVLPLLLLRLPVLAGVPRRRCCRCHRRRYCLGSRLLQLPAAGVAAAWQPLGPRVCGRRRTQGSTSHLQAGNK